MKIIKKIKSEKLTGYPGNGKIAMLTNQSAWSREKGYHFSFFKSFMNISYILVPEHGLFAELQDQVSGHELSYSYDGIEAVNLYGQTEDTLVVPDRVLADIDAVLIDIRDVGARYYTFLTTAFYILQSIHKSGRNIPVIIADSPNPAGQKTEGSPLAAEFESFVGVRTVLHRHGLTPAELMVYYCQEFGFDLELYIIDKQDMYPEGSSWVMPSPNIPTSETCLVYPGQCLLEGTNLSEGRGTTRPFEIFGAPWIDNTDSRLLKEIRNIQPEHAAVRELKFMPSFHKYSGEICGGFQIHVHDRLGFHSLLFTLELLALLKRFYPEKFEFLQGVYEFRSDRPAIELLAGDRLLLDYLDGKFPLSGLREYFFTTEREWQKKTKGLLD